MFQALFCSLKCICVLGLCISFIPYQNFIFFSGVQKHPRVQFIRMLCSNWAFILKYLLLLGQPRLLIWIVPLCCETSTNEFWLTYNFDWQIVFTEHLFQGCCDGVMSVQGQASRKPYLQTAPSPTSVTLITTSCCSKYRRIQILCPWSNNTNNTMSFCACSNCLSWTNFLPFTSNFMCPIFVFVFFPSIVFPFFLCHTWSDLYEQLVSNPHITLMSVYWYFWWSGRF